MFYRSPEFKEEQMEAIRVRLTDGAPAKRMKQVCTPGISAEYDPYYRMGTNE